MRNVVVITSNFIPNPDANGICVYNIINILKTNVDNIICICNQQDGESEQEYIDGIKICRVRLPKHIQLINQYKKNPIWENWIKKVIVLNFRRIRNLFNLKRYPRTEISREKEIFSLLEQIEDIDLIIAVYRPFEGIGAALKYKEKYPKCMVCGYFLDSLLEFVPLGLNKKIYREIVYKNEKEYLKNMDIILKPKGDRKYYEKYGMKNEIEYVQFPVFVKVESDKEYQFPEGEYSFVFAGSLNSIYRSPEYLLRVLNEMYKDNLMVHLHFFGTYDKISELKKWKEEYKEVFTYHGRVSFEDSRSVIKNADILVNITNKNMDMVPSKIYEIMAQGKPILNVNSNKNDICVKCFGDYPLLCNINAVDDKVAESSKKIKNFICNDLNKKIDFDKIYENNYTSTPTYIYEVIKKYMKL